MTTDLTHTYIHVRSRAGPQAFSFSELFSSSLIIHETDISAHRMKHVKDGLVLKACNTNIHVCLLHYAQAVSIPIRLDIMGIM